MLRLDAIMISNRGPVVPNELPYRLAGSPV